MDDTTDARYAARMRDLADLDDTELSHRVADSLLKEILTELGYHETVKAYGELYNWYA
jgi:hypothetical protein